MSEHFLFLPFLLLLLFFFLQSNGQLDSNSISAYCHELKCGSIPVRYPFWILDTPTPTPSQFCGYPGFGINCSNSVDPIFNLSDHAYHVKNISYKSSSLTLVDIDVTYNPSCPIARHNVTFDNLPLEYSSRDLNLTFYYNCSSEIGIGSRLECLKSGENQTYVSDHGGAEPENWHEFCQEKMVAPMMKRETGIVDWNRLFGDAMNEGFELEWRKTAECGECEDSNGLCGYSSATEKYLCFCKDGSISSNHCRVAERNKLGLKLGIGFGAAAFTASVMCIIFFMYQRRLKKRYSMSYIGSQDMSSCPKSGADLEKAGNYHGVHVFNYKELEEATNNFDSSMELGDGGFGIVYKGKLRDGRLVAIKSLYENNYKRVEQFMNEIEILARLRHQNLVTLYGCTSHLCRELLLVYEYIPNGTVADHLHGERARPGSLPWTTRINIAVETASALAYLHASGVIHRDVKTNNILLDSNFCVKVADFGLSRLFPTNVTHVSTAPQGTPGYVDPEYHQVYHLTNKSDVYSFGVVLIELIASKPAVDITRHRHEINLSNMAISKIQNNALNELVDPHLGFESDFEVRRKITEVAELAFRCLQCGREMRPTMQEVLEVLQRIQSDDFSFVKAEEMEIPAVDVLLLKNDANAYSPDSENARSASSSSVKPDASS